MEASGLQEKEKALSLNARGHKRAIRHHRRKLKEASAELAELREFCATNGIALIENTLSEGEPHGSVRLKD